MMQLNLIQFLFFDVRNLTAKELLTKLVQVRRTQQQNTYKQNVKRDSLYSSSISGGGGGGGGGSSSRAKGQC
jgi:uncharacterized membrane protein YgcG